MSALGQSSLTIRIGRSGVAQVQLNVLPAGVSSTSLVIEVTGLPPGLTANRLEIPVTNFCHLVMTGGLAGDACQALGGLRPAAATVVFIPSTVSWQAWGGADDRGLALATPPLRDKQQVCMQLLPLPDRVLTQLSFDYFFNEEKFGDILELWLGREDGSEALIDTYNKPYRVGWITVDHAVDQSLGRVSEIRWCYRQNSLNSSGQDRVAIDNIQLQSMPLEATTIGVMGAQQQLQLEPSVPLTFPLTISVLNQFIAPAITALESPIGMRIQVSQSVTNLAVTAVADGRRHSMRTTAARTLELTGIEIGPSGRADFELSVSIPDARDAELYVEPINLPEGFSSLGLNIRIINLCAAVIAGGTGGESCRVLAAEPNGAFFDPDNRPWRNRGTGSRRILANAPIGENQISCLRLRLAPEWALSAMSFRRYVNTEYLNHRFGNFLGVYLHRADNSAPQQIAELHGNLPWGVFAHTVQPQPRPVVGFSLCYQTSSLRIFNPERSVNAAVDDIAIEVISAPLDPVAVRLRAPDSIFGSVPGAPAQFRLSLQLLDRNGDPAAPLPGVPLYVEMAAEDGNAELNVVSVEGENTAASGRGRVRLQVAANGSGTAELAVTARTIGAADTTLHVTVGGADLRGDRLAIAVTDFCAAFMAGGRRSSACRLLQSLRGSAVSFQPAAEHWRLLPGAAAGAALFSPVTTASKSICLNLALPVGSVLRTLSFRYHRPDSALGLQTPTVRFSYRDGGSEGFEVRPMTESGSDWRRFSIAADWGRGPVAGIAWCVRERGQTSGRGFAVDDIDLQTVPPGFDAVHLELQGGDQTVKQVLRLNSVSPVRLSVLIGALDQVGRPLLTAHGRRMQITASADHEAIALSALTLIDGVPQGRPTVAAGSLELTDVAVGRSGFAELALQLRIPSAVRGALQIAATDLMTGIRGEPLNIPIVDICEVLMAGRSGGESCQALANDAERAFFEPDDVVWQVVDRPGQQMLRNPEIGAHARSCLRLNLKKNQRLSALSFRRYVNFALGGNLLRVYLHRRGSENPEHIAEFGGSLGWGDFMHTVDTERRPVDGLSLCYETGPLGSERSGTLALAQLAFVFDESQAAAVRLRAPKQLFWMNAATPAKFRLMVQAVDRHGNPVASASDIPLQLEIDAAHPAVELLAIDSAGDVVSGRGRIRLEAVVGTLGSAELAVSASSAEVADTTLRVVVGGTDLGGDRLAIGVTDFCNLVMADGRSGTGCRLLRSLSTTTVSFQPAAEHWSVQAGAGGGNALFSPVTNTGRPICLSFDLPADPVLSGLSFLHHSLAARPGPNALSVQLRHENGVVVPFALSGRRGGGWPNFSFAVPAGAKGPVRRISWCGQTDRGGRATNGFALDDIELGLEPRKLKTLLLSLSSERLAQKLPGDTVVSTLTVQAMDQFGRRFKRPSLLVSLALTRRTGEREQRSVLVGSFRGRDSVELPIRSVPQGVDSRVDIRVDRLASGLSPDVLVRFRRTDGRLVSAAVLEVAAARVAAAIRLNGPAETPVQFASNRPVGLTIGVEVVDHHQQPIDLGIPLEVMVRADRSDVLLEFESLRNRGRRGVTREVLASGRGEVRLLLPAPASPAEIELRLSVLPAPGRDTTLSISVAGAEVPLPADIDRPGLQLAVRAAEPSSSRLSELRLRILGASRRKVISGLQELPVRVRVSAVFVGHGPPRPLMLPLRAMMTGAALPPPTATITVAHRAPTIVELAVSLGPDEDRSILTFTVPELPDGAILFNPDRVTVVNTGSGFDMNGDGRFDVEDGISMLRYAGDRVDRRGYLSAQRRPQSSRATNYLRNRLRRVLGDGESAGEDDNAQLDIDRSGATDATDFRILLRYMAGLRGAALGSGATQTAIESSLLSTRPDEVEEPAE